ncbi:hypothetical protein [Salmonella phage SD-13_S19]|nr:hypothetical protein [Salmonella phage SD-11_S17]WPK20435.1 hypothetical protein [Salmonella phage SD-13_S19]WPK20524.1 hypothetical protein [Salmonella phage SD-14_S20]
MVYDEGLWQTPDKFLEDGSAPRPTGQLVQVPFSI